MMNLMQPMTTQPVTTSFPAEPTRRRRDAFVRVTRPVLEGRLSASRLVGAVGLLLLGVFVCREAWAEIYLYASRDVEYSHIFLVPFVAIFLVWVRRMRLRHFRVNGTAIGPIMVLAGLWMSSFGMQEAVTVMFHVGAVIVAIGCVVSLLGKNAIVDFLPAVVVLLFLAPVPGGIRQAIGGQLQHWTAQIAHVLLQIVGVETVVRGFTLEVNGRPIIIAEACNGMRMVFPLALIAFAFAYGLPLRGSVRLLLLLVSPLVALACNVIRTVPTIYLYGYAPDWFSDPQRGTWLADKFHDISGWAMLPISFVLLLVIIRTMRWAMLPVQRYTLASQ